MSEHSKRHVNLDNARNDEQRGVMKEIAQAGECPFCPDNLHKYHKQEILRSGEHWLLTPNQWPYDFTEVHLLAIATKHAETVAELGSGALDELQDHLQWAIATYRISSGGLAMRFGAVERSGATVTHMHAHIIAPQKDLKEDQKVRFKIS